MADSTNTKIALSGLAALGGEIAAATTHAGGVGAIVAAAAGVALYYAIGEFEEVAGREIPSLPARKSRDDGKPSRAYRLLHGRSTRDDEGEEDDPEEDYLEELEEELDDAPSEDQLLLSEDLTPPADSMLSSRIAILGVSGSGKSNSVATIVEEIGRLEVPLLLLDTEGEYQGLCQRKYLPRAVAADASRVTTKNAHAFGQLLLSKRLQVVLNLQSYESDDEAALVMCEILAGMNAWEEARASSERLSCMVILDEAAVWLPQNQGESSLSKTKDRQTGMTILARLQKTFFSTVVRRGRKRGIGFLLATQRIAEIDKRALSATWMILHRQNLPNDLKLYAQYGVETETALHLRSGQAYVIGPEDFREIVQFRKRHSPDNAFTPGLSSVRARSSQTEQSKSTPRTQEAQIKHSTAPEAATTTHTYRRHSMSAAEYRKQQLQARRRPVYSQGSNQRTGWESRIPNGSGMDLTGNEAAESTTFLGLPEVGRDEPSKPIPAGPNGSQFIPREDDKLLGESQWQDLIYWYGKTGDVRGALKGMGITNSRFFRHASFILESHGYKNKKENNNEK